MTKKLNVDTITNELEGSVFFPDRHNGEISPPADPPIPPLQETEMPQAEPAPSSPNTARQRSKRTERSANQSANQPINRLTQQSIVELTDHLPRAPMGKPKGFYISEQLDTRLDHAVRYFQSVHGIKKVDRSILINAMLIDDAYWTQESLDQLTDRLIDQLTRRLTGR